MRDWPTDRVLGMEIGEKVRIDWGCVERLTARHWRIDILGHEGIEYGPEKPANVLRSEPGAGSGESE